MPPTDSSYIESTWNVNRSGGSDAIGSGAMCDHVL
jgi:hypothetical protein